MPSQPPSSNTSTETLTTFAAILASALALAKKFFSRKPGTKPEFITRAEFHQQLDTVRDKLDARFLAVSEKLESLASNISDRLAKIEATLARIDERTKN